MLTASQPTDWAGFFAVKLDPVWYVKLWTFISDRKTAWNRTLCRDLTFWSSLPTLSTPSWWKCAGESKASRFVMFWSTLFTTGCDNEVLPESKKCEEDSEFWSFVAGDAVCVKLDSIVEFTSVVASDVLAGSLRVEGSLVALNVDKAGEAAPPFHLRMNAALVFGAWPHCRSNASEPSTLTKPTKEHSRNWCKTW